MKLATLALAFLALVASVSAVNITIDTRECNKKGPNDNIPVAAVVGTKPPTYLESFRLADGRFNIQVPANFPIPSTTPGVLNLRVYLSGPNGDKGTSTGLDGVYTVVNLPQSPSDANPAKVGTGFSEKYKTPALKDNLLTVSTLYSKQDEASGVDVFAKANGREPKLRQSSTPDFVGILYCRWPAGIDHV